MISPLTAFIPTYKGPEGQEDMPYLLTPGPLTTSTGVKIAMLADWGSRDTEFRSVVADIRAQLLALAGAPQGFECVLMQGSGTFGIEAALGSFAPGGRRRKTLVVVNGAYGERAVRILQLIKRPWTSLVKLETEAPSPDEVADILDADLDITLVFAVHCETTSGIVNPAAEIAHVAKSRGRAVMVDAMSSFGALPVDLGAGTIDILVSSSNKCIEGVPGFSYVLVRRDMLMASAGASHSLALDLYDQWNAMQKNGQFRFTPPTHALVAFNQALRESGEEGGPGARLRRYRENQAVLVSGMRRLGFLPLLDGPLSGPIIQTFHAPRDPNFVFEEFYEGLRQKGFSIYPGKLTKQPSFRIGTIGHLNAGVMRQVVDAVREVLRDMGVSDLAPAYQPGY